MLTLGLILFDYGQRTGQAGSMERVATSSAFMSYLKELEDGLIYDAPAQKGTTALTNAFIADTSRYDFITAYESAALEAAPKKSDIAVIYPSPTAVSEHAVSLLSGEWVTPQQREGALAFMQFLGTKQALQDGLKYHFRPAQAGGSLSLAPELSRYAAQGFQQSFAPIELPPYQALNAAAYKWRVEVAGKPAG
jgi:ABC-type sulfate transport system substrate-binding protein